MKKCDYDAVVKFLRGSYPEECKEIIKTADDAVIQRFIFNQRWDMERTWEYVTFPHEIDFLHQPGNDPEWIYAFNRLKHFISLGEAYHLTKDEKYASAFASQAKSWIENVRPDDSAAAKAWRTIETGIRLDTFTRAYLLFESSPAFEAIRELFMQSIKEHAEFILKNSWNSYHLMSNWGVLSNHGLYVAGVVFKNEEWEKEALRRLEAELENEVYDDGMQWEQSPMYHNEVLRDYLDVLIFSRWGKIKIKEWFYEKVHKMALVNLAWIKPDGSEPMMGDSDDIDLRDLITESAYVFKDGNLKSVGYKELDVESSFILGSAAIEEYRLLKAETPKTTGFFLSSGGNAIDRTSWDKDASYLRFHNGTLGAGHGHADQTHLSFVLKGKDFLVDAGRYTYVFNAGRQEFKDNYAHNVVIADKKILYPEKDSWECYSLDRAINTRASFKGPYTAFEGGHLGYYRDGLFINRRVIFLKDADILIVVDELYTGGVHSYESLFHFAEDLSVDIKEKYVQVGDVKLYQLSKDKIEQSVKESFISRHYNQKSENKALLTSFSAKGFTSLFTIFDLRGEDGFTASLEEVKSNFKGITFTSDQIEALEVKGRSRNYLVVVAHEEYATPTDTFNSSGCTGFGSLCVFDKGSGEREIGKRLFF